jgi:aspartate kinase
MLKVCKFGGTSLADANQIRKVCDIVLAERSRRVIVVSAPGKRSSGDTKVTDLLIKCAEARLAGGDTESAMKAVIERFELIRRDLNIPAGVMSSIESDLRVRVGGSTANRLAYIDAVKASGEDFNARIVAGELVRRGVEARYLNPGDAGMLMTDEFGNAQLLPVSMQNLACVADFKGVTVFPGFFGYTRAGEIVTFPRGGSDITGSILAAAVRADLYENFTDVDSVFTVDPRIVPNAAPITELTYREMRELAYAGFSVLHEEAIAPTARAGIAICIKNTNNPAAPGTRITPERSPSEGTVVGIAGADGFVSIYIDKYLMNREVGFGRRVLEMFEDEGISYEHMPSGIDSVSVVLKEENFGAEAEARIVKRITEEMEPDAVLVERGHALVMVVGEGMHYTVGVAAKATKALADASVNIEMINQGASEISMMFGVKAADKNKAVTALYRAFFG